jgi:hypothetical protein
LDARAGTSSDSVCVADVIFCKGHSLFCVFERRTDGGLVCWLNDPNLSSLQVFEAIVSPDACFADQTESTGWCQTWSALEAEAHLLGSPIHDILISACTASKLLKPAPDAEKVFMTSHPVGHFIAANFQPPDFKGKLQTMTLDGDKYVEWGCSLNALVHCLAIRYVKFMTGMVRSHNEAYKDRTSYDAAFGPANQLCEDVAKPCKVTVPLPKAAVDFFKGIELQKQRKDDLNEMEKARKPYDITPKDKGKARKRKAEINRRFDLLTHFPDLQIEPDGKAYVHESKLHEAIADGTLKAGGASSVSLLGLEDNKPVWRELELTGGASSPKKSAFIHVVM